MVKKSESADGRQAPARDRTPSKRETKALLHQAARISFMIEVFASGVGAVSSTYPDSRRKEDNN